MSKRLSLGPWLWGPRLDLAAFGGSAALALSIVAYGHASGKSQGELPEWTWLACVLAVDVAHVHATLFRTYFDRTELRAHRGRYIGLPLLTYATGVVLHLISSVLFWRVLAYVAVAHFVKQQVGWTRVYRARAGQGRLDRAIDEAAVYSSTLYPLVVWHSRLDSTRFHWFVPGDFVDLAALAARAVPVFQVAFHVAAAVFLLRQGWLFVRLRQVQLGKSVVVVTTALAWYVGIVATNSDFDFTVTNVLIHGLPYCVLLWVYVQKQRLHAPETLGAMVASAGVAAFAGALLVIAFIEELFWDRLVWHDRTWLFGAGFSDLGELTLSFVVPLLALPQSLHYVLDGVLWRRAETRRLPAQRAALGFAPVE
jgi:hypothetical protein